MGECACVCAFVCVWLRVCVYAHTHHTNECTQIESTQVNAHTYTHTHARTYTHARTLIHNKRETKVEGKACHV